MLLLLFVLAAVGALGWGVMRRTEQGTLVVRYEEPDGEWVTSVEGQTLRVGRAHTYSCEEVFESEDQFGDSAVGIWLTGEAGERLLADTARHENRRMGIVLEGRVFHALNIDQRLSRGMIIRLTDGWSVERVTAALRDN